MHVLEFIRLTYTMKRIAGLLFIIIHILVTVTIIYCDESEERLYYETMEEEELLDPYSFYYDRSNKMMNEGELQLMKAEKIQDNHVTQGELFYKRLVNILLSNINVEMEDDDLVVGVLSIQMSRSQMEILKNFQIGKSSLREIDSILSDAIKKPTHSYASYVVGFLQWYFELLQTMFYIIQEHREATVFLFAMVVIYITVTKMKKNRGLPILLIIQIILVASFFMTWWQLIQEAEIKSLITQMQYSEIPISCQPDKMNLWHKFVSTIFSNNDCEKYYEALLSNPKLRVTPALALSHFISTVVLHPISNVGHTISSFVTNATDDLPILYGWIVKILLFVCIGIVIISLPLFICGASFNVGLGPLLKFGIDARKERTNNKAIQDTEKREPIQIILQVSPGTEVQAIQNKPEPGKSNNLQALTSGDAQRDKDDDNGENVVEECGHDLVSRVQDLCSGDTSENNKLPISEIPVNEGEKRLDTTKLKKEIGSGDG